MLMSRMHIVLHSLNNIATNHPMVHIHTGKVAMEPCNDAMITAIRSHHVYQSVWALTKLKRTLYIESCVFLSFEHSELDGK